MKLWARNERTGGFGAANRAAVVRGQAHGNARDSGNVGKALWSRVRARAAALAALALALAVGAGNALAAAGDLDLTFGGTGKVTTPFFQAAQSSATAYALAAQPDGKVVAAGSASPPASGTPASDFALARYNANGSLDTTFSGDGKLTTDIFGGQDHAYAIAVQADGKIVAAGSANINAASFLTVFALVRYNANGSLDTSFGSGGIVSTDFFGNANAATSLALQADGKIIAAGSAHDGVANRFALARYNTDGTLDASFGTGGRVTTSFFGFDDGATALALQADGKIVAVGQAYPGGANNQFALARYNADGSLDASFGVGGKVTTDFFGANDLGSAVALLANGKIVAGGKAYVSGTGIDDFALARYNADGSLDLTFGVGGKATTTFSSAFVRRWSAAAQADGKIVGASWGVDSASGLDHFQLVRVNTDGSLDSTFSGDGKLTTTFFGSQNQAYAITVQADGKIVAAGSAFDPSTGVGHFALARYEADAGSAPGVTLSSLSLAPTAVVGGNSSTATLTLSAAAPVGGATVMLSDNSSAATVPASVTVLAGSISASFTVATTAVTTSATATISAVFAGVTRTANLTVNPAAPATPAAPTLVSPAADATPAQPVNFDWSDVAGATSYEIQIDDSSTIAAPFRANQSGITASQVTLGGLPAQRLWWRVRAQNSAGVYGPFSAVRRFEPQAASAAASLSAVSVSPSSVTGGSSATGTVTLTSAAQAGGAVVTLSDNSTATAVPASVTVAAGATSANFTATTTSVTATTASTLSAVFAGVTRTAVLTVNPSAAPTPAAPTLVSPAADATPAQPVTFDWSDVANAASYEIQVDDSSTFAAPFRANQAGITASQVTLSGLPAQRLWWRVRAQNSAGVYGAFSAARRFTPQAAPAAASLSSISVNPASVAGSSSSTGTATLTAAAPSGGAVVTFTSSNSAVANLPSSVTVAAGATSATFTVTTTSVGASTPVTLTGTYNGTSRTATLTVTPVPAPGVLITADGALGPGFVGSDFVAHATLGTVIALSEGAVGPVSWAVVAGALPNGLSLADVNTSGTPAKHTWISVVGVPTQTGTSAFSVRLIDANGVSRTGNYTITINAALSLVINLQEPWTPALGIFSNLWIDGTGGSRPYVWSVVAGALPPGMALVQDNPSGPLVRITGTPTVAGAFTFTLRLRDAAGAITDRVITVTVAP